MKLHLLHETGIQALPDKDEFGHPPVKVTGIPIKTNDFRGIDQILTAVELTSPWITVRVQDKEGDRVEEDLGGGMGEEIMTQLLGFEAEYGNWDRVDKDHARLAH